MKYNIEVLDKKINEISDDEEFRNEVKDVVDALINYHNNQDYDIDNNKDMNIHSFIPLFNKDNKLYKYIYILLKPTEKEES